MKIRIRTALSALVAVSLGNALCAQESEWEWRITPYAFLTGMDATSTLGGRSVNIDLDFGDVIDTFDVKAFSARVEGWKGKYGFVLDGYYVDLDADVGPATVDLRQQYLDVLAGYRIIDKDAVGQLDGSYEFTTGVRFNDFRQELILPPGVVGGTENWADLMFGFRAVVPVHEAWVVNGRFDIGGFGLEDSADMSTSLTLGAGWLFHRNWVLDFGYRYYILDYSTPERSDGEFGIDGNFQGVFLGLTWLN